MISSNPLRHSRITGTIWTGFSHLAPVGFSYWDKPKSKLVFWQSPVRSFGTGSQNQRFFLQIPTWVCMEVWMQCQKQLNRWFRLAVTSSCVCLRCLFIQYYKQFLSKTCGRLFNEETADIYFRTPSSQSANCGVLRISRAASLVREVVQNCVHWTE